MIQIGFSLVCWSKFYFQCIYRNGHVKLISVLWISRLSLQFLYLVAFCKHLWSCWKDIYVSVGFFKVVVSNQIWNCSFSLNTMIFKSFMYYLLYCFLFHAKLLKRLSKAIFSWTVFVILHIHIFFSARAFCSSTCFRYPGTKKQVFELASVCLWVW